MRLLALFPTHMNPEGIAGFVRSTLGDDWEVTGADAADADPEALEGADAILDALVPLRREHLERARKLRFVQTPSHGFDHIDVEAAAERGIPVANVGTSGAEAANVAEHAFLLMLACAKRLPEGHEALRGGRWANQDLMRAGLTELHGKTLGIVGLGQIGREVAKRGAAFGMELLYHDVVADPEAEEAYGLRRVPLDELLETADAVTVHVPLLDETRGLIGPEEIAKMRDGAILVNTARGPVVDAEPLAEACRTGRLRAGIDVFDPEPPPADHPLLDCPNVVLSPHVAGTTGESVRRIMAAALENLRRCAASEDVRDVINGVEP